MDGPQRRRSARYLLAGAIALASALGTTPARAAAIRWTFYGETWGFGPRVGKISGIIPDGGTFEGFGPTVINVMHTDLDFPPDQVEMRDGRPYEFRAIDSGVTMWVNFTTPEGGPLGDRSTPWLTLSGPLSGSYGRYADGHASMSGGIRGEIDTRRVSRSYYEEGRWLGDLHFDPDRSAQGEDLSRFVEGIPLPVDVLDAFLRASYRFDGSVGWFNGRDNLLKVTLSATVPPGPGEPVVVPEARTLAAFAVLLLGLLRRRATVA